MITRKLPRLSLTLLVTLVAVVACQGGQTQTQQTAPGGGTTLEQIKSQGFISAGFANEKPYAYATETGELTGEAAEVARAIFKRMGVEELQPVLTEFGSLIPGLKARRFDVITAGMFIKPERCQEVIFANPEYTIGEGLLVKKGNPHDLHSYEDIAAKSEVKLGVMAGAYEYDYATEVGVSPDQIVTVPDNRAGIDALLAERIDALTATGPSLQALLETTSSPEIERVKDFKDPVINGETTRGYGAAAFRKEDTELRDAFNKELQALKESGELLKIIEPFGFTEQELPGDVTAEELCKTS